MLNVRTVQRFQEQQPSAQCYNHLDHQLGAQYNSSSFPGQLP